jgi:hypothetical protein
MSAWLLALLIKPAMAYAFVAVYFFVVYRGSHLIGNLITSPRAYDFLFRERGMFDRRYGLPAVNRRRRDVGAGPRYTDQRALQ